MKYINGFRNPQAASHLSQKLEVLGNTLGKQGRTVRIMEVCGTHTMAIARFGIRSLLPSNIELVSGPGCPVCVTTQGYIDAAIELAGRHVILASFGDMVRVPGSDKNLAQIRAQGGDLEVCYSPNDALAIARKHSDREIVFLAVGFETTIAPFAALLDDLIREGISNLSLLTAFKLIPPAIFALLNTPDVKVDGFLLPAHVSTIIGTEPYRPIVEKYNLPCVVAGFEPLDILHGLLEIVEQLVHKRASLVNHYSRVAKDGGNPKALQLMNDFLEPCDGTWRGLGTIPESALKLRNEFSRLDAQVRYDLEIGSGRSHPGCRCGEVLTGRINPVQCQLFERKCKPDAPLGPCMVSSEGSCQAAFRYRRAA